MVKWMIIQTNKGGIQNGAGLCAHKAFAFKTQIDKRNLSISTRQETLQELVGALADSVWNSTSALFEIKGESILYSAENKDFNSNSRRPPFSGLDLSAANILYLKIALVVSLFLQCLWFCRHRAQKSLARETRRAHWHEMYTLMGNKTRSKLREPQCID